jgi:DNA-binding PadR family transcriptional regulator
MSLEHILLGMLHRPASGYDLKVEFDQGAKYFWSAELSQIYPTLEKMERSGWLKSKREPSPRGPARRVYRRTPRGTRELQRWLAGEPIMGTERFAYIAQLVFLGEVADLQVSEKFLKQLRERLFAFQQLLEGAEEDLRRQHPHFPDDLDDENFHGLMSVRIGIHSLRAKVAACDDNLALIRSRAAKEKRHVHRA